MEGRKDICTLKLSFEDWTVGTSSAHVSCLLGCRSNERLFWSFCFQVNCKRRRPEDQRWLGDILVGLWWGVYHLAGGHFRNAVKQRLGCYWAAPLRGTAFIPWRSINSYIKRWLSSRQEFQISQLPSTLAACHTESHILQPEQELKCSQGYRAAFIPRFP